MTNVFHRTPHNQPPIAVGGKGMYLVDEAGKEYIDASGGAAVSCLGHGDPEIIKAIQDQAEKLAFAHTGFLSSEPAEELANILIEHAPEEFGKVFYVSGGSEAVESALKLACQYHLEKGQSQRRHIIARRQSFHGNTLGVLAVGGNEWRRRQFEPLLIDVSHIAPCFAYRDQQEGEAEEAYGLRVANELEAEILRLGEDSVAAFVAETVVGATAGVVPPVKGYFKRIREICDQYGVLLILDEVMCGLGRTGSFFAFEQEDIVPDMITVAKGLGGGYQPIGALLCTDDIYNVICEGSGFFQHSHTYMGHPIACAAALAVMNAIFERGLLDNVREMGDYLEAKLVEIFGQHPHIGDLRGRGLFRGIEIVKDRETKEPFDPALKMNVKIKKAAFENGMICYPMGGTIDGENGDHVLLAPPFIATKNDIDNIVGILDGAINSVLSKE
ncbi:MAG: aspartate aminotransferase family protein [Rhodospirillaceae bacterium]|jgi:adenosylmethionine-8-amino-7-oxononanoate aminotransferase|nr:aspartate aminotransferase family protein [Rhodospirillaceae bacterium]MBT4940900.1 aspartate aminotransferase family protein [Rhodospirillaceae bacterium]MBT5939849.1 aspartate aminotransferase family protein [Rhodospirillaceae bacterium]MBT7265795.1 aspartate aminotransferase family protein [Rhodospirillaceae bacterium]